MTAPSRIAALVSLWLINTFAGAATPEQMISEIAQLWAGQFDNHRHIEHNAAWGGPTAPELSTEKREMRVVPLSMPEIGDTVLYLEEYRDTQPGVAHRQRVISLVWDDKFDQVRAQQFFFRAGPTYDRKPLDPAQVARLAPSDFDRIPRCDLFFVWDGAHERYHGSMKRRACTYEHVVSGMVYAEFDLLLYPTQQWYRDRSMKLSTNSVRGEIDGFSYLRFDRLGD